nr:nonstructural protein 3 [Psittaciform chaphamaparvovirus 5]
MSGFSLLIWVKPDCSLINELHEHERAHDIRKTLLQDACTLIGCRWSMDMTIITLNDELYAYGLNTRFTVATQTIKNALGDLLEHVELLRGTAHSTAEELASYKRCKERWNVPDQVSDTTSGWDGSAQESTSQMNKRRRF